MASGARQRATELLDTIERDASAAPRAASELLPLLYDELKSLARQRMAHESPGQTLQATALVHEAYLRLVGERESSWNGRGHFFAAAAAAMRRILVERARSKSSLKRGGARESVELEGVATLGGESEDQVLGLDQALAKLSEHDARKARVVELRYFAGLTLEETAAALDVSLATVKTDWAYARAWLHRELTK